MFSIFFLASFRFLSLTEHLTPFRDGLWGEAGQVEFFMELVSKNRTVYAVLERPRVVG